MKKNPTITFEGSNEVLVWRTNQNFGTNTEAIVPFSHEAVFVKDGQIIETLGPGKHVLNEKSGSIFARKDATIDCAIYYVNKTAELNVPWGTSTPLDLMDAMLNVPVRVGASGDLVIKVNNPRKLLAKLVGTSVGATTETVADFFRSKVALYIKDALANAMITNKISFYEIGTKLILTSKAVENSLRPVFDEYGVEIISFVIENIVIPEQIKREMEEVFIAKQKMSVLETNYKEKRDYDIKENESRKTKSSVAGKFCTACGTALAEDAAFCHKCGKKQ